MATPLVRRNDSNHDRTFGGGMRNYASGSESTEQRIRCALLYILGEWYLDTDGGTQWIQQEGADVRPLLGVRHDQRYAESVLKAKLLSVPGVATLVRFSLNVDSTKRTMTVSAFLLDDDGNPIDIVDAGP